MHLVFATPSVYLHTDEVSEYKILDLFSKNESARRQILDACYQASNGNVGCMHQTIMYMVLPMKFGGKIILRF